MTVLIDLFFSFMQIGMFCFGGGYAAIPLIQGQVVDKYAWLTMAEFTDLVTISQMTPGPIAINAATFVGIRIAGVLGAITATLGCVLPSCIIVIALAKLYLKYKNMSMLQTVLQTLRPAVVAMIGSAGISILVSAFWGNGAAIALANTNWHLVVIFVVCVIMLQKFKMNPVLVMVSAGGMNLVYAWIMEWLLR